MSTSSMSLAELAGAELVGFAGLAVGVVGGVSDGVEADFVAPLVRRVRCFEALPGVREGPSRARGGEANEGSVPSDVSADEDLVSSVGSVVAGLFSSTARPPSAGPKGERGQCTSKKEDSESLSKPGSASFSCSVLEAEASGALVFVGAGEGSSLCAGGSASLVSALVGRAGKSPTAAAYVGGRRQSTKAWS